MRSSPIFITDADAARLRSLLSPRARASRGHDQEHLEDLAAEVERATVVAADEVPHGVVTLHSNVLVVDLDSGARKRLTLVFPAQADAQEGRVSVLAPLGCALMGYREGDVVEWEMPGGLRRLRIEEVRPAEHVPARTFEASRVPVAV